MRLHFFCLLILGCFTQTFVQAQFLKPIFIPDTLEGPMFNLNMAPSSASILPGKPTPTLSYNGQSILGPTLILRKGMDVDAMITNNISDSTTLHWHGIHLPAHADGGPHMPIFPGLSNHAHFTCLDPAGTNWYHPHFHGKTGEQTLKGAAGMIIVRDDAQPQPAIPGKYGVDDFPLIIQSLEFDTAHRILPKGQQDSIVLVNGIWKPYCKVPAQMVRLRVLNASNARNFVLGFPDNRSFSLIGTDNGLLGSPVSVTRMKLAPGERVELVVDFSGMNGQSLELKSFGSEIPPGTQGGPTIVMPVGSPPNYSPLDGIDFSIIEFRVQTALPGGITTLPDTLAEQTRYPLSQSTNERTIVFSSTVPGSAAGPFLLNDSTFNMERIDFSIPVGTTEIWTISNQTVVAHPFHMHGFPFYIIDRYGAPVGPEERGRKDMVMVSPNETLRIITWFSDFGDTEMPYMFHCHILTHEDEGMMGQFIVLPEPTGNLSLQSSIVTAMPNPFTDFIQIRDFDDKESLRIFNALGVEMPVEISASGRINTSDWPAGIYVRHTAQSQTKLLKL